MQKLTALKPTSEVLGVKIHCMTMSEVIAEVGRAVDERRRLQIGVVNAAKLVNMLDDELLRSDVVTSDLVLADGMSVVWASRLNRQHLPCRVAGIDLMHEIMRVGAKKGVRVFFLGAKQEICQEVVANAQRDYPGLQVAGMRNGYFDEADEQAIVDQINSASADVLFLAMTSPKKERFMGRWAQVLDVPVLHGVGGSFDVYAGKVKRAPKWMQQSGLEWFYRVIQEPGRMWKRYLTTNLRFVWELVKGAVRR
jgi:N-acetylglucosaminyldiphosphoundecaprenol N-acetyl-beta-D-mannosaminyltransferase